MQNWTRLYSYIHEYQSLVYDYYSRVGVAFLINYYNLDTEDTIWDDEDLMGGYYERLGKLSGIKYNKYLLLPVYFIEEITTSFDGRDEGLVKEQETSFVIPSVYGITPYVGDIVKLEQSYMRPENNVYPLFIVTGAEIHPNTDRRFWKLKIKVYHSDSQHDVEDQVSETFVFFDYDKKIHTLDDATTLAKLLYKHDNLRGRLKELFDPNSGFYQI